MDDLKTLQQKNIKMHFWLSVSVSLLLFVIFVLYLPLRFLYQTGDHGSMMMEDGHAHDGHTALQHEEGDVKEGLAVNFNFSPAPLKVGTVSKLDFFVNEKPDNTPIAEDGLQIEHEKIMHVIGVRSDMNEFFHIHPEATENNGIFSVQKIFSKPGRYKVWSEVKKDDVIHGFGHPEFSVVGQGVSEDKKVSLERTAIAGEYQVILASQPGVIVQKQNTVLSMDIHSKAGGEVELGNFLGVPMHLAIIKDDWSEFIHTHPRGGAHEHASEESGGGQASIGAIADAGHDHAEQMPQMDAQHGIIFDVEFPSPGLYRAFGQFRPKGMAFSGDESLVVSFWLKVEERSSLPVSEWWMLLFSSGIAIAVLGWATKKFIQVK